MPTATTASGARAILAVAAVGALGLLGALQQYSVADQTSRQFQDPLHVTMMQERIRPALARIPVTARVGYLSDVPFSEGAGQSVFFNAQYAIAPRLLLRPEDAGNAQWWIGVFGKKTDLSSAGQAHGLILVQDLGGEVALYKKDGR